MSFDYSSYSQVPNNWVKTKLRFSGPGIAIFEDPEGQVSGHTTIYFNEYGDRSIRMSVQDVRAEQPLRFGLASLLNGDHIDGPSIPLIPDKNNPCVRLSVKTKDGEFNAENFDFYIHSFQISEKVRNDLIDFRPAQSWLIGNNYSAPKYWALPLVNFVSDFADYHPTLANHPLRIFPDAVVSEDIPPEHREIAAYISHQYSHLILFHFQENAGFIEALPDYKERVARLSNHQVTSQITAVLVCSLGDNRMEDWQEWFPYQFLELLSLASGAEVTSPWIEFHDECGGLVKRIHVRLGVGSPMYTKSQPSIDEISSHGTGKLLSCASQSPELTKTYLKVAIQHVIRGRRAGNPIEERMDHFCRGLDALCEEFGFAAQNLLDPFDEQSRYEIRQGVKTLTQSLRDMQELYRAKGELVQVRYLDTIRGRLANITNKERSFGLAVCHLLQKFGLPDAEIVDLYLREVSLGRIDNFAAMLSSYRGRAIHTGYFNVKEKEHDLLSIWFVTQHIQDILLRVIFLILGYDGGYNPPVLKHTANEPLNWVKSETPAANIGYIVR